MGSQMLDTERTKTLEQEWGPAAATATPQLHVAHEAMGPFRRHDRTNGSCNKQIDWRTR